MNLRFKTEDVRRILEQSKNDTEWREGYAGPTGPGVFIVGDNGVYLMSTGKNQKKVEGKDRFDVVYAEECNPETMEFDDWWENKRATFGGDDGADYLEVSLIEPHLQGEFLELRLTPQNIEVVVRRSKQERLTLLRQAWKLRHGFRREKLIPIRMELIREGICTADEWDAYLAEGDPKPKKKQSGKSGSRRKKAAVAEPVNPQRKIHMEDNDE